MGTREAMRLGIIGPAAETGERGWDSVDVRLLAVEFRLVEYSLYGKGWKPSDMVVPLAGSGLMKKDVQLLKICFGSTQLGGFFGMIYLNEGVEGSEWKNRGCET